MGRKNLFVFVVVLLAGCAEMPLSGRTMQFDGSGCCVSGC
jgi:hypothetical protein